MIVQFHILVLENENEKSLSGNRTNHQIKNKKNKYAHHTNYGLHNL